MSPERTDVTRYTDLQLDALRELANIGSGTASTALSSMLGRSVDISVPSAFVLPMAEAVGTIGDPEAEATGVVLGVVGEMQASVLLLFTPNDARLMCGLLGVEAGTEIGVSALMEIGNIVGTSYINALSRDDRDGARADPAAAPPPTCSARSSRRVLAERAGAGDVALLLDSDLVVEGEDCSVSFLLVPDEGGVELLLARLGL